MAYCSTYRIIVGGTTYLSNADEMEYELSIGNSQLTAVTPLVRAEASHLHGGKNVSRVIRWSRIVEHADWWTARAYILSHSMGLVTGKVTSTIDFYDDTASIDATATYTSSVLETLETKLITATRSATDYVLIATGGAMS